MVMGVLSSALDLAKAAVAHDQQGALPEKVLPYYKKVNLRTVVRRETKYKCKNGEPRPLTTVVSVVVQQTIQQ